MNTMTTEQLAALKEVAEKAIDANHNAPNWFEYQASIENFRAEWTPTRCLELLEEVERLRNQWDTRFNTLCGNCGKRYLGPRDEEQHGLGICGGTK